MKRETAKRQKAAYNPPSRRLSQQQSPCMTRKLSRVSVPSSGPEHLRSLPLTSQWGRMLSITFRMPCHTHGAAW